MKNFNLITIKGICTRDPEMTYTPKGTALTKFSIACNNDYGDKKHCDFFNVQAWGKLGEVVGQWVKKGNPVLVSGRMESNKYEEKIYWNINAQIVEFLSGGVKKENSTQDNPVDKVNEKFANVEQPNDEDIPF